MCLIDIHSGIAATENFLRRLFAPVSVQGAAAFDLSQSLGPKLEDTLTGLLSFEKFCSFPLDVETPDETTFVRFRPACRAAPAHNLRRAITIVALRDTLVA